MPCSVANEELHHADLARARGISLHHGEGYRSSTYKTINRGVETQALISALPVVLHTSVRHYRNNECLDPNVRTEAAFVGVGGRVVGGPGWAELVRCLTFRTSTTRINQLTIVLCYLNSLRARSRNRFAAARGCKEPARYPQPETILGFHFLRGQLAAARSHGLLAGFQRRHDDFGNTFSVAVAGRRFICTIEPDNVRAVLSTNFHDYSVAHSRDKPFGPLIGHGGVFTSDGATWEHARVSTR
jgi:hypothetical protein